MYFFLTAFWGKCYLNCGHCCHCYPNQCIRADLPDLRFGYWWHRSMRGDRTYCYVELEVTVIVVCITNHHVIHSVRNHDTVIDRELAQLILFIFTWLLLWCPDHHTWARWLYQHLQQELLLCQSRSSYYTLSTGTTSHSSLLYPQKKYIINIVDHRIPCCW